MFGTAVAGHNAYYYSLENGELINCYSFDSGIGCVDETADQFFIRTLEGECGGISIGSGAYTSYGKLIDCTTLKALRSIKVNDYYYAYAGVPKSGNNDQAIFYNYKDNSYAEAYTGEVLRPQYLTLFENEALKKIEEWKIDTDNAVSVDSDMKIIAGIEDMEGVSTSGNSIIMDTVDNNRVSVRLAYKIYSLDELLNLAEEANEFYYPKEKN